MSGRGGAAYEVWERLEHVLVASVLGVIAQVEPPAGSLLSRVIQPLSLPPGALLATVGMEVLLRGVLGGSQV